MLNRMSAMTAVRQLAVAGLVLGMLALAAAQPKPPEFKVPREEQELIDLTNAERAKMKLPPLKLNAILTKNARDHSTNMAKHRKMVHALDGKTPDQRADEAGYDYEKCNENIGWWTAKDAKALMGEWMKSKFHRDNILGDFEETGVGYAPGLAPNENKKVFWVTQVFGTRQKKQ